MWIQHPRMGDDRVVNKCTVPSLFDEISKLPDDQPECEMCEIEANAKAFIAVKKAFEFEIAKLSSGKNARSQQCLDAEYDRFKWSIHPTLQLVRNAQYRHCECPEELLCFSLLCRFLQTRICKEHPELSDLIDWVFETINFDDNQF